MILASSTITLIIYLIIVAIIVGIGIYGFVLFIKFANKGLKASDKEKTNNKE